MSEVYRPKLINLVGVGGIGSWLVRPLSVIAKKYDVKLKFIDFDHYEDKNFERLPVMKKENKAKVAANIAYRSSGGTIDPEWDNLKVGPRNARFVVMEDSLTIVVTDNHVPRRAALEAAQDVDNCWVIIGGNAAFDDPDPYFGSVAVYTKFMGKELTPNPLNLHPDLVVGDEDQGPGCDESPTQAMSVNYFVGAVILSLVEGIFEGRKIPYEVRFSLNHDISVLTLSDEVVNNTGEDGKVA